MERKDGEKEKERRPRLRHGGSCAILYAQAEEKLKKFRQEDGLYICTDFTTLYCLATASVMVVGWWGRLALLGVVSVGYILVQNYLKIVNFFTDVFIQMLSRLLFVYFRRSTNELRDAKLHRAKL